MFNKLAGIVKHIWEYRRVFNGGKQFHTENIRIDGIKIGRLHFGVLHGREWSTFTITWLKPWEIDNLPFIGAIGMLECYDIKKLMAEWIEQEKTLQDGEGG